MLTGVNLVCHKYGSYLVQESLEVAKAAHEAKNSNSDEGKTVFIIILQQSYSPFLHVLIIEHSITVGSYKMLLNGVMLKG